MCREKFTTKSTSENFLVLFFSFFAKAVDLGDYNAGKNNVKEFLLSCPGFHHTVIFCVEMVLDF